MTVKCSHFVMIFFLLLVTIFGDAAVIHAEEENGFYYEYETYTAQVPEVNLAVDRVTLTDPADKQINVTENMITISAKIRIGTFVETGYVVGDRNWRLTFFAANSTNHRLSVEFPAKLSYRQQAMDLDTSSTLTFNNVKGDLLLGSLNCSTFSRICAKIYESDEGFWVKGERSFDIACTDITCHHGINRGAPSEVISHFLIWVSLQTAWMCFL